MPEAARDACDHVEGRERQAAELALDDRPENGQKAILQPRCTQVLGS